MTTEFQPRERLPVYIPENWLPVEGSGGGSGNFVTFPIAQPNNISFPLSISVSTIKPYVATQPVKLYNDLTSGNLEIANAATFVGGIGIGTDGVAPTVNTVAIGTNTRPAVMAKVKVTTIDAISVAGIQLAADTTVAVGSIFSTDSINSASVGGITVNSFGTMNLGTDAGRTYAINIGNGTGVISGNVNILTGDGNNTGNVNIQNGDGDCNNFNLQSKPANNGIITLGNGTLGELNLRSPAINIQSTSTAAAPTITVGVSATTTTLNGTTKTNTLQGVATTGNQSLFSTKSGGNLEMFTSGGNAQLKVQGSGILTNKVDGLSASDNMAIGDNNTTGEIQIGCAQTSGDIAIGNNGGRSGTVKIGATGFITLGDSMTSGTITCLDAGTATLDVNGAGIKTNNLAGITATSALTLGTNQTGVGTVAMGATANTLTTINGGVIKQITPVLGGSTIETIIGNTGLFPSMSTTFNRKTGATGAALKCYSIAAPDFYCCSYFELIVQGSNGGRGGYCAKYCFGIDKDPSTIIGSSVNTLFSFGVNATLGGVAPAPVVTLTVFNTFQMDVFVDTSGGSSSNQDFMTTLQAYPTVVIGNYYDYTITAV